MQQCTDKWTLIEGTKKDLEVDFKGLRYIKADGLNAIGETRVYTEEYADSEQIRVYIPPTPTHKQTTVTFEFAVVGDTYDAMYKVYSDFLDFCMDKRMAYWDTARKRRLYFYVTSAVKPKEELLKNQKKCLRFELLVNNIFGTTNKI